MLERTVRELAAALPATEVIITLVEGLGDCSHAVWDTSGEVHIVHHADEDALDSVPGAGTSVTLSFPRARAPVRPARHTS